VSGAVTSDAEINDLERLQVILVVAFGRNTSTVDAWAAFVETATDSHLDPSAGASAQPIILVQNLWPHPSPHPHVSRVASTTIP
jgi:hypothetical protein